MSARRRAPVATDAVTQLNSRLTYVLRVGAARQNASPAVGSPVKPAAVAKKFACATEVGVFPHEKHKTYLNVDFGTFLKHLSKPLHEIDVGVHDVYGSTERANAGPVDAMDLIKYWEKNEDKIPTALQPKKRASIVVEMVEMKKEGSSDWLAEEFREPEYAVGADQGEADLALIIKDGPVGETDEKSLMPLTKFSVDEWILKLYARFYYLPLGESRYQALFTIRELGRQWHTHGPKFEAVEYAYSYHDDMQGLLEQLIKMASGRIDDVNELKDLQTFTQTESRAMLTGETESADNMMVKIYVWLQAIYKKFSLINTPNMAWAKKHLLERVLQMDTHAKASIFPSAMLGNWVRFIRKELNERYKLWFEGARKDYVAYLKALDMEKGIYVKMPPELEMNPDVWETMDQEARDNVFSTWNVEKKGEQKQALKQAQRFFESTKQRKKENPLSGLQV